MEHFSDGKTMSWYELAKKIVGETVKLKEIKASSLKLRARRAKNTSLA
jgi:dTDP-4-dehydrorhamnose reductase